MTWYGKMRLKILAYVVGLTLGALGIASLTTVPAWPVVGVAVAACVVMINRAAHRLSQPTCLGCGRDIAQLPTNEHGVACPGCGMVSRRPEPIKRA